MDQVKSHCPNLRGFSIKKAAKISIKQPCTNYPTKCDLCPDGVPAVWKYNFHAHILSQHPSHNVSLHENAWHIDQNELILMKAEWKKVQRNRLKPPKEVASLKLRISNAHSSLLSLQ